MHYSDDKPNSIPDPVFPPMEAGEIRVPKFMVALLDNGKDGIINLLSRMNGAMMKHDGKPMDSKKERSNE